MTILRSAPVWVIPAVLGAAAAALVGGRVLLSAHESSRASDAALERGACAERAEAIADPFATPADHVGPVARAVAPLRAGSAVAPRFVGPAVGPTLVALLGFAAWIAATVLLIRRGLAADRAPAARAPRAATIHHVLLWLLLVVGFALFVVGPRLA